MEPENSIDVFSHSNERWNFDFSLLSGKPPIQQIEALTSVYVKDLLQVACTQANSTALKPIFTNKTIS